VPDARWERVQALLNEQQLLFNTQSVGLTMRGLVYRKGKKEGQLVGRTAFYQSVFVTGNARLMNNIIDVKITSGYAKALTGDNITTENTLPDKIQNTSG